MTLSIGDKAPSIDTQDETGERVLIPSLERWTFFLFSPVFKKYGCRDCQTSLLHELYPEFRIEKCFVYGATYTSPKINARRNEPHGVWRVPLIQIDHAEAQRWDADRSEKDSWYEYAPRNISYLIDPTGLIHNIYVSPDYRNHAEVVLDEIRMMNATTVGGDDASRSRTSR